MTNEERHWLAGLLEGEACFSVQRRPEGPRAYLRIHMIDRDVIEQAAKLMGKGSVWSPDPPSHRHTRPRFATQRTGRAAQEIMKDLYLLLGKRRRAQIDAVLHECDPNGNRYTAAVARKEED